MRAAARFLRRLEYWLAGLVLFAGLALVCLQIVGRTLPAVSFLWSEELSRYLLIWTTYLGASAATQEREHIRAELMLQLLPPGARGVAELLITLVCLAFCLALSYAGVLLVRDSMAFNLMSADSNLPIPVWAFQFIVPVGFGLISIRLLLQLVAGFRRTKRAEGERTVRSSGSVSGEGSR